MCGIAGFYRPDVEDPDRACRRMLASIEYRGPDGCEVLQAGGFMLGHLRLAIIDLTDAGRQPMVSADRTHAITYNGEIYNYRELRAQLDATAAVRWRGESDTEVLLECLVRWGVVKTLERANGMFAFALVDLRNQHLVLARDRFGEKPLCYCATGGGIVFASEVKALEAAGFLELSVSRAALARQFASFSIPAPLSIYRECRKLPPGCYLEWQPGEGTTIHRYWSARERIVTTRNRPFEDESTAIDELEAVLLESTRLRMVADVPIGCFLSGGTDSAVITALMQSISGERVKTFTIGFEDPQQDESGHARAIAAHLGTEHHERIVTGDDALAVVPLLGGMYDEPFSDSSQIPTWLVSRMAREQVTVCLSGDGGDELFCGYARYAWTVATWARIRHIPLHTVVGRLAAAMPASALDVLLFFLKPLAARHGPAGRLGPRVQRFATWMSADDIAEFYRRTIGTSPALEAPLLRREPGRADEPDVTEPLGEHDRLDDLETMMLADTNDYLPNDILVKFDRASMAVSLEGRVPMLDPAVFDTAWRIPLDLKRRDGVGKWALKQVLYRHVPARLMEREKQGFGAPVGHWMRTSLREWTSDLLSRERLERQRLYDAAAVQNMLDAHLDQREDHSGRLWSVVMAQAWIDADASRAARLG